MLNKTHPVLRYGNAVLITVLATLLRMLLQPALGARLPFITFFAAIAVAAWYGGLGPALVTLVLSTLAAAYFFISPYGSLAITGAADLLGLGLFGFLGLAIALLCESLRAAQRRAETSAREAVHRQEELEREIAGRWRAEELNQRAEEALRASQARVATTLRSIGDAVIATDSQGQIDFMNPVAEALTGWTDAEARGAPLETVFVIVNEETRQPVQNPVTRVLREGVTIGLANHTVLIARDGRELPIDDSGAPIRDEQGMIAGVVLIFRDVTERRRAEETRLQLAAIVESSDDAILGKTLDGIITSWNASAERLYGYTAAEVIGRPVTLLAPAERHGEIAGFLDRLKRGERVEPHETVRVTKDGRRIDVSLTISPIRDATGRVRGAATIARDITAWKRAHEAERFLAQASALLAQSLDYERTLERVPPLVVPHLADWCIVDLVEEDRSVRRIAVAHADPARLELTRELLRYPPDPNGSQPVPEVLRTGRPVFYPEITDATLVEVSRDAEHLRILRGLAPVSGMGVPILAQGRTLGAITFMASQSGRHYGPAELELAQDLARRIALAIDNARLYRELQEADRRKDEFLAMLAHELRNPLAPILNAMHVLRLRGPAEPALRRQQEVIERQVGHMTRLLDDLLDVSRITQGRIDLDREPVELTTVLDQAVEASRGAIEARGHTLSVSLPPERVWLEADLTRLVQVVSNLLNNAAKYTDPGGRITVSAGREGDEAVIRVHDTGIGIAPELLPRVFDLFMQADRALDRSQGGLGIGLTMVQRLVKMHGGRVAAFSEGPGHGSEFAVWLPVLPRTEPKTPDEDATTAAPTGPSRRVLIVDDNVDAAQTLAELLELSGHAVQVANDGPTALQVAAAHRPEVVLLDIGLPGMDGYEVAERLRHQAGASGIVLVALTGYGQAEDRRRSRQAGFDHHLVKPVELPALQTLIATLAPEP